MFFYLVIRFFIIEVVSGDDGGRPDRGHLLQPAPLFASPTLEGRRLVVSHRPQQVTERLARVDLARELPAQYFHISYSILGFKIAVAQFVLESCHLHEMVVSLACYLLSLMKLICSSWGLSDQEWTATFSQVIILLVAAFNCLIK